MSQQSINLLVEMWSIFAALSLVNFQRRKR